MTSEPLRTIRDRFSEFVDRVQLRHERITVTRNGTAAAVLISPQDLESLEETVASSAIARRSPSWSRVHRAFLASDLVRGSDAARALRPE